MGYDFKHIFGDVIPEQYRGIQQIFVTSPVDLILTDISFWGTLPLLLGARELRPLIIGCGVLPVLLSSQDVSLLSLTTSAPNHRDCNSKDRQEFIEICSNVNDYLDNVLVSCGAAKLPAFFLDVGYILPDRFFQFTATAFEFPRSDLPDTIEFIVVFLIYAKMLVFAVSKVAVPLACKLHAIASIQTHSSTQLT